MFTPMLSPISLAPSYSVFGIPFFLCSKIIFCGILSLLMLMILWINIRVEYSIPSFADHILVYFSNPVESVVTGSSNILTDFVFFFIACIFFLIFSPCFKPIQYCWYKLCLKEFNFYLHLFLPYILF